LAQSRRTALQHITGQYWQPDQREILRSALALQPAKKGARFVDEAGNGWQRPAVGHRSNDVFQNIGIVLRTLQHGPINDTQGFSPPVERLADLGIGMSIHYASLHHYIAQVSYQIRKRI
jgi:hypothetical protein